MDPGRLVNQGRHDRQVSSMLSCRVQRLLSPIIAASRRSAGSLAASFDFTDHPPRAVHGSGDHQAEDDERNQRFQGW